MKQKLLLTLLFIVMSNMLLAIPPEANKVEKCPSCKPKLSGDIVTRSVNFPTIDLMIKIMLGVGGATAVEEFRQTVVSAGHSGFMAQNGRIIEVMPDFDKVVINSSKGIKGAAIRVDSKEDFLAAGVFWGAIRHINVQNGMLKEDYNRLDRWVHEMIDGGTRYAKFYEHNWKEAKGTWHNDDGGYRTFDCSGFVELGFEKIGLDLVDGFSEGMFGHPYASLQIYSGNTTFVR